MLSLASAAAGATRARKGDVWHEHGHGGHFPALNPFAAPACPPGYTEHEFFRGEEPVRLCPAHGPWLRELSTRYQIVWATAWGADANRLLAPRLQIPDLPVIGFPPIPFHPRDKLPAIIRFAGRHTGATPWPGSTTLCPPRHTPGPPNAVRQPCSSASTQPKDSPNASGFKAKQCGERVPFLVALCDRSWLQACCSCFCEMGEAPARSVIVDVPLLHRSLTCLLLTLSRRMPCPFPRG